LPDDAHLLEIAQEAAAAAGARLMEFFGSKRLTVRMKYDYPGSLVTNADQAAERVILGRIRKGRIKSTVLSEEAGTIVLGSRDIVWAVDPLDGTLNFVSRIPHFSVSIGMLRNRRTVAGVIYNPILNEMFTAIRGQGAYLNGRKIHVSTARSLKNAALIYEWWQPEPSIPDPIEFERKLYRHTRRLRSPGSVALNLCSVACGRFDGSVTVFRRSPTYETAAGCLIAEEASGTVTSSTGETWEGFSRSIVAGGGRVHGLLLRLMNSA